jgi:hypothetical protein
MGGHSSLWISACNQHLVRSMSSFCHSPIYFRTGGPGYTTCVDVTQLWRNYRALFTRTSANSGDYIYGRSYDLSCRLDGGTLRHEYHLNDFWRHWAAHVDSQFIFHMNSFNTPVVRPPCFSHISLFPSFDVWGYDVSSSKRDSGWIYLKDATPSSFALITRKWIPFGAAMEPFAVTVKTPPLYAANTPYTVNRYHYRTGAFSSAGVQADAGGRLTLSCAGGMGEEIGIQGSGLRAALALLTDTLFENITLRMDRDTVISGDVVNLSNASVAGASVQVTSASPVVTVLSGPRALPAMAARSRLHLDTLAILRGTVLPDTAESLAVYFWREKSTGFIKARFRGAGLDTAREQLMQVDVAREIPYLDSMDVRVFDGRSLSDLPVFRASAWGGVNPNEITYPFISEGSGNGDGVPDDGEAFSVWVRLRQGMTPNDSNTWHPAVCVNGMGQPGVVYLGNTLYLWDRSRTVISGLYRLTRTPADSQPLDLILRTEVLNTYPGGQQNIDVAAFRYIKVRLPLTQGIGVERGVASGPGRASLRVYPNPFNPVTRIEYVLPRNMPGRAAIAVYDIRGRKVWGIEAPAPSREGAVQHVRFGKAVSAGLYLVRLTCGDLELETRAMLVP